MSPRKVIVCPMLCMDRI